VIHDVSRSDDGRAEAPAPLLAGRRVLVTGGARGLGAEIARTFAAHGADVSVIDLGTAEDSPWPCRSADVRDEAALQAAVGALAGARPFDGLVAAAGVVPSWQEPEALDLEDYDRVMAVNARGLAASIKLVAPTMAAGSTIVAIGSLNSWKGDPNLLSYVASKHAVLGIVRASALALGPRGVRVNAIAPGPVATEALLARIDGRASSTGVDRETSLARSAEATALRTLASPQNVADAALFLSSALSGATTGHLLPVDGGVL